MNEASNLKHQTKQRGGGHRKKHRMRRLSTSSSLSSSSSDIDIASYNALIMTQNYMLEQEIRKKLQEYFDKYNKYKNMPVKSASKKIVEKPDMAFSVESEDKLSSSDSPVDRSYLYPMILLNKLESINNIILTDTDKDIECDSPKYTDDIYNEFIDIYNIVGDENAIDIIKDKLPTFILQLIDGYINGCMKPPNIKHIGTQNKKYPKLNEFIKDYLIKFINQDIPQKLDEHMREEQHSKDSNECKIAEDIIDKYIKTIGERRQFNSVLFKKYDVESQNLEKVEKFKSIHFTISP
uniref:Uncharacterized protein n=1 Tax=viral metagenome TaxID=1070528 RepID=A0A6C0E060_9ZZZZ